MRKSGLFGKIPVDSPRIPFQNVTCREAIVFGSFFQKTLLSRFTDRRTGISKHFSFEPLEDRYLLAVLAGNAAPFEPDHLLPPLITTAAETPSGIDIGNLNSKPDSLYSIYLDFDGHITSGTNWNTIYTEGADIVTPRFTLDGNIEKGSFTDAEKAAIHEIWLRVSEDYIPFDVNVTTVEPSDESFLDGRAQRVVIGGRYTDWFNTATAGISWVGTFTSRKDVPNFVFSESLNGNVKTVAEVASHETGHTLGLNHKGNSQISGQQEYFQGSDGWAPIMGASYYQELTQWSKGEYAGANNHVDELQVISTQNGFGYRDDDYSDSFVGAARLEISEGIGKIAGIIERNTDIDFFLFESDGTPLSFYIGGLTGITNLDVLVTVYSEDCQPIRVCNPSDSYCAEFTFSEEPGFYYISVEGTGLETDFSGIYSDYGSLGNYTIQVGEPESLVVTTLDDTFANDGLLSLREAVLLASDCTTILFDESLAGGTIFLTEGEILLCRSIVIDASSAGVITIDAQGSSRLFEVTGDATLIGFTLSGGGEVPSGSAIYNNNRLALIDCRLIENIAVEYDKHLVGGGALFNAQGATASISDCELVGNIGNYGGAIYNAGTLTISETAISDSMSWQHNGGAVYNEGYLSCTETLFAGNSATAAQGIVVGGGAVYNAENGTVFFNDTRFEANSASFGGAILNFGLCELEGAAFEENIAEYYRGGGIYNCADLRIFNSTFRNNHVPDPGNLMVGGGAIYNAKDSSAAITQSLFIANTGHYGGALVNAGTMTVTGSTFTLNRATGRGGGAVLNAGTLNIGNSIVAANVTDGFYPDIYQYQGTISGSQNLSSFTDWTSGADNIVWNGLSPFADPDRGDFTPLPGSQAVDTGANELVATETDLAGNRRIDNGVVDIGAYEYIHAEPIRLDAPMITSGKPGIFVSYGANRHRIAWTPSENAAGYELSYSGDNGTGWTTVSVSGTGAVVTGLAYGAKMQYRVRALGTGAYADSDWSEIKTFNVCPMDINGDCDIGGLDRNILAVSWGAEEGDGEYEYYADINADGDVGGLDRNFLGTNWGAETGDGDLIYPPARAADAVFSQYDP